MDEASNGASAQAVAEHLYLNRELSWLAFNERALAARATDLLAKDLLPALASRGIRVRSWAALSASDRDEARSYFRKAVFPILTPLAVDPVHPFPFLSNLS